MKAEDIKIRINQISVLVDRLIATKRYSQHTSDVVDSSLFMELRTTTLSFLKSVYGTEHPYFIEFDKKINDNYHYTSIQAKGILTAIENEINGGWIFSVKGLISAEIFSDFLEMAEYFLNEGYKDPAAVMIGSVLEEHLRQLCQKHNIPLEIVKGSDTIHKKADTMNADLCKTLAYNKLDQKQVTTWLDLRNKAAHGKYSEYTKEQVDLMYQGVVNFISRIS